MVRISRFRRAEFGLQLREIDKGIIHQFNRNSDLSKYFKLENGAYWSNTYVYFFIVQNNLGLLLLTNPRTLLVGMHAILHLVFDYGQKFYWLNGAGDLISFDTLYVLVLL